MISIQCVIRAAFRNHSFCLKLCLKYTFCKTINRLKICKFQQYIAAGASVAKDCGRCWCIGECFAVGIFGREGSSVNTSLRDCLCVRNGEHYLFFSTLAFSTLECIRIDATRLSGRIRAASVNQS
jgi:hypothetical protein